MAANDPPFDLPPFDAHASSHPNQPKLSGYPSLLTVARKRLTDGLCSNLGAVCASAASLLAGGGGGGAAAPAAAAFPSSSSSPAERAAQAALHRAALKAYVFFVSWLQAQADEEDKSASAALTNAAATAANAAAAATTARGARKKKNAAGAASGAAAAVGPSITWTWDEGRPRVAAAMAALAGVDLRALWRLAAAAVGASTSAVAANNAAQHAQGRVDAGLLSRWVGCSVALLSSQAACRDRALRASLATALGAAAHGDHGGGGGSGNSGSQVHNDPDCGVSSQLETVAASLVDALRGRDGAHLPLPLAELAAAVAASYGGDDRLAGEMLRAVAGADPREYEGSSAAAAAAASAVGASGAGGVVPGEGAAAKAAGAFLVELAERMPRTVGGCVALLVPHLGGKAFALRSGIVATMAILVHRAFSDDPGEGEEGEGADGGGEGRNQPRERSEPSAVTRARLRTKQHLLDILLERSRDKNPFTRARVLGAWAHLADRGSLPLGHWNAVAALAAARLEDRVALVRKGALHLLTALMLYNPFGPVLPRERFAASAAEFEARLRAAEQEARARERESTRGGEEGEANAAAAAASNWGQTAVKVEGEAGAAAAAAAAPAAEGGAPMLVDSDAEGEDLPPVTLDPAAEQLRALVASLRCAAAFSAQLTAALPTVVQLLASATLSDVTEALATLVCAARFEVGGAEPALRRALLLVFSREAGVPDAAVRAVAELRLAGRSPEAAAASLVELASGATLGELSALDEVMGRLLLRKPAVAAGAAAAGGGSDAPSSSSSSSSSSAEPLLRPAVAAALWPLAAALGRAALPSAPTRAAALPRLRGCLSLLASLAARVPRRETAARVPTLLASGFGARDAACARAAAEALSRLAGGGGDADASASALLSPELAEQVHKTLVRVILSPAPTAARGSSPPFSASSCSSGSSPLGDGGWYGAADAALRALLALHPAPHAVAVEVLRAAAGRALGSPEAAAAAARAAAPSQAAVAVEGEEEGADKQQAPPLPSPPPLQAGPLARLLFLASRVALAQLVAADSNARVARKRRLAAEGSTAKEAAGAAAAAGEEQEEGDGEQEEGASEDDDLAAVGGGGGASKGGAASAAASDLDALRDAAEASVLSSRSAPGALAPLIVAACGSREALAAAPCLRAAAPLALAALAAVDGRACAAHAGALFAAAADGALAPRARCSLVVASGDLAARHPNAIEPWTACLYAPLSCSNPPEVRRDGLLVLSHLVLNDMVKVRGHGAALAARLADRDPAVAALAALFFHELARRATAKGGNPVYNMLPDVLSSLAAAVVEEEGEEREREGEAVAREAADAEGDETAEAEKEQAPEAPPANSTAIPKRLSPADFQRIMGVLLSHVGKERQADALVDKLASRMGPEARRPAARAAAFCLASLSLSEKGVRRVMELLPSYKSWCGDEEVAAHLRAVAARARRLPKAGAALKGDADAWEARVAATGAEITGKRLSREGGEGEGAGAQEEAARAARGLSAAVRRMSLVGGGGGEDDEAAAGPSSPPGDAALDENAGIPAAAPLPAREPSTAPALGEAGAAGNVAEVTPPALGAKHAAAARGARAVSVAVSAGVGAAEAMQVTPLQQRRVVSDDDDDE